MKKWRQSERRNKNQLRKRNTLKIKERLAATNQKEETLSKDQKGPQTNKTKNFHKGIYQSHVPDNSNDNVSRRSRQ